MIRKAVPLAVVAVVAVSACSSDSDPSIPDLGMDASPVDDMPAEVPPISPGGSSVWLTNEGAQITTELHSVTYEGPSERYDTDYWEPRNGSWVVADVTLSRDDSDGVPGTVPVNMRSGMYWAGPDGQAQVNANADAWPDDACPADLVLGPGEYHRCILVLDVGSGGTLHYRGSGHETRWAATLPDQP